jgi:ATP-dependent DNA helicase RecG
MNIGRESEILEFKKSTGELSEGVISIAAILNKHGSGELYFGIRNDGTALGQQIGESTLRDVSQAVAAHIDPKIFPTIELVYLDDKPCVYVRFSGDYAPYLAYGRGYIRVADEDRQMPASELEDFILRKNARKDIWDSSISEKTPDDVSNIDIERYHERAMLAGRISFPYTNKEDTLIRLGMLNDDMLTNAAAVFFCGAPLLEVQMAVFAGTERLTFNDIQRDGGNTQQLAAIAERYVRNNIRWKVVLDGSLQRKEIPEIPMDAVREAIINSYCHRDYISSQNNAVMIYSNRVEIYNPGKFPEGLAPEDFIKGSELSIKRNPLLAQLMYYVKDIESFGTGLKRISDACEAAGVKVEFEMRKLGFAVVFYRPGEQFDATEKVSDVVINVATNVVLNKMEQAALSVVTENPAITAEQLAARLSKSGRTAQRYLDSLQKKNLIRRVGAKKDGHWIVTKPDDT